MDARLFRLAALAPALALLSASSSQGANFSTQNFVVTTADPEFARQVAETAEHFRAKLARDWLGQELPRWFRPCQVSVTVGQIGAGGATTFTFAAGQVFGWNMKVQGTAERILDSVIPHEVSHTIFASYFRRPLPRWADEGAASLVEHESERRRQSLLLQQVFNTPQRIPLNTLISMKEYPGDMQSVLTLYAEGYSLADYLVQSGGESGKERYLRFLQDGYEHDWNHAIRTWYGLPNIASLERRWSNWVTAGSPDITDTDNRQIAQADAQAMRKKGIIVRSQSPDNSPASYATPQYSSLSGPANAIPRGDEMEAPAPVMRTQRPVHRLAQNDDRLAPNSAETLTQQQAATARREGLERMVREGWEPIPKTAAPSQTQSSGDRTASRESATGESVTGDNGMGESAPRRRLRNVRDSNVRDRHEAESSAQAHEQVSDVEDPFGDTRLAPAPREVAPAESPFHEEN